MKFSKILIAAFAVLTFAATANVAHAQDNTSTVTASGTVLTPITVSGTNLSFGSEIFPGNELSVAPNETGAAQFDISGEGSKEINVQFTLPDNLTSGDDNLDINFVDGDASHSSTSDADGATGFDPNNQDFNTSLTDGALFIWLGGTVAPTLTQEAGDYEGEITLELFYTGN